MSLRLRMVLYALTVVAAVTFCLYWGASSILLNSFEHAETEQMLANLERAERAWQADTKHLEKSVRNFAANDTIYDFLAEHNQQHLERNLSAENFSNLGVNFIALLDSAGELVAARAVNLDWSVPVPLDPNIATYLEQHSPIQVEQGGLIVFPEAVLQMASAPILRSDYGGPARGSAVIGRFVDARATRAFGNLTQMDVSFFRLDDPGMPEFVRQAEETLAKTGGRLSQAQGRTSMAGYVFLDGLDGAPALLLQVKAGRPIYARAQHSWRTLTQRTFAVGVLASLALLLFIQRGILSRFSRLSAMVRGIAESGDTSRRLDLHGRDELARLGGDINDMLAFLENAQEEVRTGEARYVRAVSGVNDGLWDWNLISGEVYYSPRFAAMLGHEEKPIRSTTQLFFDAVYPEDLARVRQQVQEHLAGRTAQFESEFRMTTPTGYRWMLSRGLAFRDAEGRVTSATGSLTDISQRGIFDPLTGLPNRLLLCNRLSHLLTERDPNLSALFFLDLNRFKSINDSLGHHVGDLLLIEVARRLQGSVRQGDTVARLGGDEFVILLRNVSAADVHTVLERVHGELAAPYDLDGQRVLISASIGILSPLSADATVDDLLRDADIAMYEAKKARRPHSFFESSMRSQVMARQQLENDRRDAVAHGGLSLVFQPVFSLQTGHASGVEALVRWYHPVRGPVPPSVFIPIAEETGIIHALGDWVLREACLEAKRLGPDVALGVNLSSKQFDEGLADRVMAIVQDTGFAPQKLILELSESALTGDPSRTSAILSRLREVGTRIALDDFGTGYSSLSHLSGLPLDILKIDQGFVAQLAAGTRNVEIVRTIVALAQTLDLTVVAEGVETPEQADLLIHLGCRYAQGYYFAPPVKAESLSNPLRHATANILVGEEGLILN